MFYLKYRPQTIHELDNSQIRERMMKLLASKEIPHALLFVGPKGMGKTSTARIFAKAVNCDENVFAGKGSSIEPCNTCVNCTTIDKSGSPDVVEQDAASNRGIDEIRKLIRESSFAPMSGRYRVYIIDEAHMITGDAFNALLKTLEEPPKSVIFILATTNEEKLPSTIISRCVRFPFGTAQSKDIVNMLKRIATQEKLDIPEDLMTMISNYSENSFRDATKLLEELVMQEKLTFETAEMYLGIRSKGMLIEIMQNGTLEDVMLWIEEFVTTGGNVKRVIEDTLNTLRVQLVAKSTGRTAEPHLSFSLKEISVLIKLFHEAYGNMRISPIEALPLELAVVEFYNGRKERVSS